MMQTETKQADAFSADIFVCGNLQQIESTCRRFCLSGFCVSVAQTRFIYTGGAEDGATVRIINYPRFPKTESDLLESAIDLASQILKDCCQRSCTVQTPRKAFYIENETIKIPR